MMIYMSEKLQVEPTRTEEGMIESCVYAQPSPWEPVIIKYRKVVAPVLLVSQAVQRYRGPQFDEVQ